MKNEKYPEYERCKARYHDIQETFSRRLLEHERDTCEAWQSDGWRLKEREEQTP